MPVRKGNAEWNGDLKSGTGRLATESGALKGMAYSFTSRFEEGTGTNPEELIAAAHAACFSMALAAGLSGAGYKVASVRTEDRVHIVAREAGFVISKIEVSTEAKVDGIDEATFLKIAEETKTGCPVSGALKGPEMTLTAKLVH
ncbi:MAG TPA: OsmC family protein [Spirochaetia bacterium]|nr:OsmC family protein [Spirochaetia bacterium]